MGIFTYEYQLMERTARATLTISRLRDANGEMFRLSYRPIPAVEVVTDFDARLSPTRGRLIGSGEERRRWDRIGNEVRSTGTTGTNYAVPVGEGPVVFGGANLLPFLAAAVDWQRCSTVRARYFVAETRTVHTALLRKAGTSSMVSSGVATDATEIAVEAPTNSGKIWVTTKPPSLVLQYDLGNPFVLVAR